MWLIGSILLPLMIFAFIIHKLERLVQIRLAERFGWKVILWTGWLGTPIHELSHALMCLVFRHKIDDMQLFEPDLKSGRLGYVKHSFRKGNWFEEIGNVFIGVAPLVGGIVFLVFFLYLFYPDVMQSAVDVFQSNDEEKSVWKATWNATFAVVGGLFDWSHLFTPRFWLFIYLVLCVGTHMAPSRSDYHGARRGIGLLAIVVFLGAYVMHLLTGNSDKVFEFTMQTFAPIFAVLLLAVLLCMIAMVVIFLVTIPIKQKYVVDLM